MPADIKRELLRARHQHVLRCADAADTSGMNRAAEMNAEVAKQALDWYQAEYAKSAPDRGAASAMAMEQAGLQNQLAKEQLAASQQERNRYNNTFAPIEQRIAKEAIEYDTPARREAAARAAVADTEIALSGQQQASRQAMERRGVAPNSGKVMAMQGMMDLGAAKLKAGAANTARQQVETVGSAKLMDAAGLGRGVVSNQATTAGIALNAGNSATANGQVPVAMANSGAAMMGQGFQTAIQGNTAAGNLYGQAAQIQASSNNDGLWGALGSVAGAGLSKWIGSDRNTKEGIEPVDPEKALEAVKNTPVSNWAYREGVPSDDGGQPHTGPMAQDVNRTMGEKAAPAGKMIDLTTVTGVTLAAVQALDKKVSQVAAAVGLGEGKRQAPPGGVPAAAMGMPA